MATKKNRESSRLAKALIETADDMRQTCLLDEAVYEKITMRHPGMKESPNSEPLTSEDIRMIRQRAHMSQAVFAHYLNLTVGYVSQLERGLKRPTGAALTLLNVIRHKGIEAIL